MFDVISLAETYISRIYCPNYDNFGWAAIDDNILVGCISYNYLSNQY